jgi:hypothetical protein
MADTRTADDLLSEDLVATYMEIRNRDLPASKEFYFKEIMPRLEVAFDLDPHCQEQRSEKVETLVSLMGYSPETTVIAATILRPQRLIVAYSADAQAKQAARPALNYLTSRGILDQFSIEHIAVDAFDPNDIYGKLRERITSSENLVFDITGGTKLMSATAGSLAWELNLRLCYLDGGWDPRSGSSGLKRATRLRLIENPSRQKGYEVRRRALQFYKQGNFVAAQQDFNASRTLIAESLFDHLAWDLCACYQAFTDLNQTRLGEATATLRRDLEIGGLRTMATRLDVAGHLTALESLAGGDRLARLAAFLELSESYRNQSRHDFSCLLSYRAMEGAVELGLRRICPDFDPAAPDYARLGDCANLEAEFDFDPRYPRKLPPKLGFFDMFQLLCILDSVHERLPEPLPRAKTYMKMRGQADLRNRSILAHGYQSLSAKESAQLLGMAQALAVAVLRDGAAELGAVRAALRPRDLEAVLQRSA